MPDKRNGMHFTDSCHDIMKNICQSYQILVMSQINSKPTKNKSLLSELVMNNCLNMKPCGGVHYINLKKELLKHAVQPVSFLNIINDLCVLTQSVEDKVSCNVFSFLTCLLQPWSVCVEVVDPNAGGRYSLRHLI